MTRKRQPLDDGKHLFACETCNERFTRFENLKRHQRNHGENVTEQCPCCEVTCRRRDLLKRHVRKFHPDEFIRLYSHNDTTDAAQTLTSLANEEIVNGLSGFTPSFYDFRSPAVIDSVTAAMSSFTPEEVNHYLSLYWNRHFPVVHQATFDPRTLPLLTGAMICIATDNTALWSELVVYRCDGGVPLMQAHLLLAYYGYYSGNTDIASQLLVALILQVRKFEIGTANTWKEFVQVGSLRVLRHLVHLLTLQASIVCNAPLRSTDSCTMPTIEDWTATESEWKNTGELDLAHSWEILQKVRDGVDVKFEVVDVVTQVAAGQVEEISDPSPFVAALVHDYAISQNRSDLKAKLEKTKMVAR